jgi:hypothetical protein
MAAGGTATTALSTALAALSPGQLLHLGHLITQSNEMKAMQILQMMQMNPAGASSMLVALEGVPNVSPQVITWASAAITNPASFAGNIAQAMAALQAQQMSILNVPSIFGN